MDLNSDELRRQLLFEPDLSKYSVVVSRTVSRVYTIRADRDRSLSEKDFVYLLDPEWEPMSVNVSKPVIRVELTSDSASCPG